MVGLGSNDWASVWRHLAGFKFNLSLLWTLLDASGRFWVAQTMRTENRHTEQKEKSILGPF